MVPKIIEECVLNEDVRCFHLNTEISKSVIERIIRNQDKCSLSEAYKAIGPIGEKIIQEVMAINGIEHIFIQPFNITVTKGRAFEWKEIEEKILTEILPKAFSGRQDVEITYQSGEKRTIQKSSSAGWEADENVLNLLE